MGAFVDTKDYRIKKRGDVYWAVFMKNGIQVKESLRTRAFALAQKLANEIEESVLQGKSWKKSNALFDEAWEDFIEAKAKGIKTKIARDKTLREYIGYGERYFLKFFGSIRIDRIEEAWPKYVEWVREQKPDILFFNHRKYLYGFLAWAKKTKKIQERPDLYDPDARRKMENDDEGAPTRLYSDSELLAMRAMINVTRHEQFKLALFMAMFMGMRSSEITQLKKNRIDWAAGVIRLRPIDTKTGEGRVVPIHPRVWGFLRVQFDSHQDSPCIFPNAKDPSRAMDTTGFKKPWKTLKQLCGIVGRFHDHKHTFITGALKRRMNPVALSKIVGTSIRVIEKVYLHFSDADLSTEIGAFRL